jgi:hypothetical protein
LLNRPTPTCTGAKLPFPGDPTSYAAYSGPLSILDGTQWVFGRGGGGGIAANWNVYPDIDWVSAVLSNSDDLLDFGEILAQEQQAITGQPVDPPGGG